jgi:hypothetical protein
MNFKFTPIMATDAQRIKDYLAVRIETLAILIQLWSPKSGQRIAYRAQQELLKELIAMIDNGTFDRIIES